MKVSKEAEFSEINYHAITSRVGRKLAQFRRRTEQDIGKLNRPRRRIIFNDLRERVTARSSTLPIDRRTTACTATCEQEFFKSQRLS